MIFKDGYYCKGCGKKYTNTKYKWCKLCQTSGNKQIDDFIQEKTEKQSRDDIVFEWILYNQFENIKEIGRSDFSIIYSAIWKNGPLYYDDEYRNSKNEKVTLKYWYDSKNKINEFLNEV